MSNLSKTAAIAKARRHVSIVGRYIVIGPYRNDDPTGPYTEASVATWEQARERRASWVADIALTLMGIRDKDAGFYCYDYPGSVEARVAYALRQIAAKADNQPAIRADGRATTVGALRAEYPDLVAYDESGARVDLRRSVSGRVLIWSDEASSIGDDGEAAIAMIRA